MGKKGFVKNTVKGSRKGSKWPEDVKTACLSELLIDDNIHLVARRHGVPESTLRGWVRGLDGAGLDERRRRWAAMRESAMERIAVTAAAGAQLSVEMIGRRLAAGERNARRCEEIRAELVAGLDEDGCDEARLLREMELRPPLGDYPLANFTRTLLHAAQRARQTADGTDAPEPVRVDIEGEVVAYAE